MTLMLVSILLLGFILIATGRTSHINKAVIAMSLGIACWLLYLVYGSSAEHAADFQAFLGGRPATVGVVREFIARSVSLHYISDACEIVLYLLATKTIVEVLDKNGCFDLLSEWLRTRSGKHLLWLTAGVIFVISANLDNLTTVCMMLAIMRALVANRRQRIIYGVMIVIAANCGGAFTVIGDMTSLNLWVKGVVTPTHYSALLLLLGLAITVVTGLLMVHRLPNRLELVQVAPIYRGDDTTFNRTQRLLMLLVGIGGLWLIPKSEEIQE